MNFIILISPEVDTKADIKLQVVYLRSEENIGRVVEDRKETGKVHY